MPTAKTTPASSTIVTKVTRSILSITFLSYYEQTLTGQLNCVKSNRPSFFEYLF